MTKNIQNIINEKKVIKKDLYINVSTPTLRKSSITNSPRHHIISNDDIVLETKLSNYKAEIILIPAKLTYFFLGLSQVQISKFLPLFYKNQGKFTETQIGGLGSIHGLCFLLSPPLWGAIGDACQSQRFIHNLCLISSAILTFLLMFFRNYDIILILVFFASFQLAPVFSFLDQAVLSFINILKAGQYGRQRLGKSLGSGLGAILTGFLRKRLGFNCFFYFHIFFAFLTLITLQKIPLHLKSIKDKNDKKIIKIENQNENVHQKQIINQIINENKNNNQQEDQIDKKDENDNKNENENDTIKKKLYIFMKELKTLLKRPDVVYLIILSCVLGILQGGQNAFFCLYISKLGEKNFMSENHIYSIIGIAAGIELWLEIPAYYFSGVILRYLGVFKLLLFSIICYSSCFFSYTFIKNPWHIIPLSSIYRINYSLEWVAVLEYMYNASSGATKATSLGILNSFNGIGRSFGAFLAGYITQKYGYIYMWRIFSLISITIVLTFVILFGCTIRNLESKNKDKFTDNNIDNKKIIKEI